MKKKNISFLKDNIFCLACSVLLSILIVLKAKYEDLYFFSFKFFNLDVIIKFVIFLIFGSFMIRKLIDLLELKKLQFIKNNEYLKNIFVSLIIIIIFIINEVLILKVYRYDSIYYSMFLLFIFIFINMFLIIKQKHIELHQYLLNIFINSSILFLIQLVLISGLALLYLIYISLFRYEGEAFYYLLIFELVLSSCVSYFICLENINEKINAFFVFLIKYIMMATVIISFLFFYIYLFKIIINRDLPRNEVFSTCSIIYFKSMPIILMNKNFENNNIVKNINKYLVYFTFPIIILQIISLFLRISQYGFTLSRYMGIYIIVFELFFSIIYCFKYEKIKYILIIMSIFVLLLIYAPFINIRSFV